MMRFASVILCLVGLLCFAQAQIPMTGAGKGVPSGGGGGGVTFKQFVKNTNASSTSISATLTGITSGSIIAVATSFAAFGSPTITSVTDSSSDTVTASSLGTLTEPGNNVSSAVYAFLAPTAGVTSVTVNYSGATSFADISVWEIAGLATKAYDQQKAAINSSTTAPTVATGVLASATEGIIAFISAGQPLTASSLTASPGTYTFDGASTANNVQSGHDITAATTTVTCSAASPFAFNVIYCVSFK